MPSVQPMTPAPLPPEEIERLTDMLTKWRALKPGLDRAEAHIDLEMAAFAALPALLAEIEAGRAIAERVRDDALAEAEALAEKFAEDNGMRSDHDIRGAAREQAAEDIAAGIAALRQAAQPATRADLAQVAAQPAATVSEAHANVFRDVEVRWGERGFGLTIRHRVSDEVLAEIPAGFTLHGLYIRPAVSGDYEVATPPTSGAGDGPTGIKYIRADIAEGQVRAVADAARREAVTIQPLTWLDQSAADFTLFAADTPLGRFVYGTDNRGQPYHQDPHGEEDHLTEADARRVAGAAHVGLLTEKLRSLGVLPAPPQPDPVAAAREAVVKAAMARRKTTAGSEGRSRCNSAHDKACAALAALEAPQTAPAKHACHDCGCKIPAAFDLCGNCQMGRDEGEPT